MNATQGMSRSIAVSQLLPLGLRCDLHSLPGLAGRAHLGSNKTFARLGEYCFDLSSLSSIDYELYFQNAMATGNKGIIQVLRARTKSKIDSAHSGAPAQRKLLVEYSLPDEPSAEILNMACVSNVRTVRFVNIQNYQPPVRHWLGSIKDPTTEHDRVPGAAGFTSRCLLTSVKTNLQTVRFSQNVILSLSVG